VQHGQYRSHYCDRDWSNERYELKEAGYHTHDQSARQTQQRETDRADYADEETRSQLSANISGECAVDVLKKLVTSPAPTAARQHKQSGASKTLSVFQ